MLESAVTRGKYAPLFVHLQGLPYDEWRATFVDVEKVLGFELPDSARLYRPWWANQGTRGSHTQALAWEIAGWKTTQVDMDDETVTFVRKNTE